MQTYNRTLVENQKLHYSNRLKNKTENYLYLKIFLLGIFFGVILSLYWVL